ncbi:hypothetical protein FIBSPDRAFT_859023 [Athelia psychrophila]|uniref:Uncharacterized protein n=1 Tax=Athelia psychrophila TaxID=1759441 RepID=A0A166LL82_9AGAM|nr:hypothetical protein FIBSPDRAFT_859023 [Fibularhizoctonia sp. CBS 109695]
MPSVLCSVLRLAFYAGLVITTSRWFVPYIGFIRASTVLYERLLESILFAKIRFHNTVATGLVRLFHAVQDVMRI